MNRYSRLSAIAVVATLIPAALAAQQPFEGSVTYSMQMGDMGMEIKTLVKGDRVRQEISGTPMGEVISLVDSEANEITMIIPAQRAYMTMDMGTAMAMAQARTQQAEEDVQIERTGRMETVAGHECENVIVTSGSGTIDMCIATDLGFFFMGGAGGGGRLGAGPSTGLNPKMEEKMRAMFEAGFFPLKVTSTTNGQVVTVTATAIEEMSVSDDMFVVPAGYTRMPGPGGD